jgi:hypothetical protein
LLQVLKLKALASLAAMKRRDFISLLGSAARCPIGQTRQDDATGDVRFCGRYWG